MGCCGKKYLILPLKEEVMKYNNDHVRRRDRLLAEQRAIELIDTAEYGVLSMTDEEGMPYAIRKYALPALRTRRKEVKGNSQEPACVPLHCG